PRAAEIAPGERHPSRGMARRDNLCALAVEGEDVQLTDVLPDREDLLNLVLQEQPGLELVPIPDGRGDFPGKGDGAVLQIVLDPSATQAQTQRREAERRDDHHGDAEENQLLAHTKTHDSFRYTKGHAIAHALERREGLIRFIGALVRAVNLQELRLPPGSRAPPCGSTLLAA